MITETMYVIAVRSLEAAAKFYRDALGFTVRELGDSGWRIFESGACRIMAGECPDALPARELGDHSYFAYLVVDDVDGYARRAEAAGAEIIKPPRDEPWGAREVGIRTNDGHRIMLATRRA